jgi:MiaB/RimO family radical SAM methylthiotransferase
MMNPFTVKKNIDSLQHIYSFPKLYKFLHLPLQTADNDLLQKMNRRYTVNDFLEIITLFKTHYPTLTLSTDIIVGFPTETDTQFKKTITLLQQVKPDIINITRYSARPYTTAKIMNGRIPTEIVKERSKKLTQICKKISEEKNKQHIGKHYTILVTERGKNNTSMGRAENYKPVIITEQKQLGELVNVEIIKAAPTHLFGKLI